MSVYRIYVVKRDKHAAIAKNLLLSLKENLNINNIDDLKIINRYDVENLTKDDLNLLAKTVFAEPMVDDYYLEDYPFKSSDKYFAVEYLPGQYDQRADSATQCAMVITGKDNIIVRCAKVYLLTGNLSNDDVEKIKNYIINKIDQKEASINKPDTLKLNMPIPEEVKTIDNFIHLSSNDIDKFILDYALAMNNQDVEMVVNYFKNQEKRNPTETEIRLLDTYWSDHCRHTTFNTILTDIKISDGKYKEVLENALKRYLEVRKNVYGEKLSQKEISLMDMAVINAKYAKKQGYLNNLEISDENNACSIEVDINTLNGKETWLLQFKNETHNHPTEIEPFGGAATCLGGAIRDPLSGRAYVYHAMRITGGSDPNEPINETLSGKLSQRKITTEAAKGFSSYGNQIGLATGFVQEYYHKGFVAKRLETGAVIGAVPKSWVRREKPTAGDAIILVGGRTGRDGIGGATGSSKEHDVSSIELCGAEVQKGNPPEEHKIQRLFRKKEVSNMIKKCNDFGAGGVGVAIGELADGLLIDLNKVPKKYEGLSGTELAISESQERMAVVVSNEDVSKFIDECHKENLEATEVAKVTDNNRLQMIHNGKLIVDISRDFLDSAGASRFQNVIVENPDNNTPFLDNNFSSFKDASNKLLSNLNICSQKGLVEMFDSTIGASSVLTPFGGLYGNTPTEYMAAKFPVLNGDTDTISVMASGYNPYISSWSPYHGGMYAILESVTKVVSSGAKLSDVRLSLQEYFERLNLVPEKWGKPVAALLGAITIQDKLNLGAIGGKDSMSGTFKDKITGDTIDVPPTLISFAVAPNSAKNIVTPEFKNEERKIYFVKTPINNEYLPDFDIFKENAENINNLITSNKIESIYTIKSGGIIEALYKSSFGNMISFNVNNIDLKEATYPYYGSFIISTNDIIELDNFILIGNTIKGDKVKFNNEELSLSELLQVWVKPLENVFTSVAKSKKEVIQNVDCNVRSSIKYSKSSVKPSIAMLALPGVNCEYDMKRIFEISGSKEVTPFVFRNRSVDEAKESCIEFAKIIKNSQILAVPGGFSAGDEPEGSGKFFVSVFKNEYVKEAISELLEKRDGLAIGICNGFQALIKTGILTYGKICDLNKDDATLSFNTIGRHLSQMVRLRTSSIKSPWLNYKNIGDIDIVPISHGEGRFTASKEVLDNLVKNGQIAFQYVDNNNNPTMEAPFNPNGSDLAIEGIFSPCGRVLGKMAHSERIGSYLHLNNKYGNFDQKIFKAGVNYFTGNE